MNSPLPRVIAVVGPTASGKTALSLELARTYAGVIISADSRQIYTGMDIGTAKIQAADMHGIPHFLLNVTTPDKPLSLAEVQEHMKQLIYEQSQAKSLPIVVGGTGLYVNACLDNWVLPHGEPNMEQRKKLENMSITELLQQLQKLDPAAASRVDKKNPRRLIRALEIAHENPAGSPPPRQGPPIFDVLWLGIQVDIVELEKRIYTRVDQQIQQGLVNEVCELVKKYSPDLPALSGIGYAEIIQHLQGRLSLQEAIHQIKLHTRQYARRQMTWFKRNRRIRWVNSSQQALDLAHHWLASK